VNAVFAVILTQPTMWLIWLQDVGDTHEMSDRLDLRPREEKSKTNEAMSGW
jgi:hypothetical protein